MAHDSSSHPPGCPIAGSEVRGLGSGAERLDDTGTKNARLRHRWHPHPNPDIEMVERRGCEPDDDFAPARSRVRDVLVTENLGPALVVGDARPSRPPDASGTVLT